MRFSEIKMQDLCLAFLVSQKPKPFKVLINKTLVAQFDTHTEAQKFVDYLDGIGIIALFEIKKQGKVIGRH